MCKEINPDAFDVVGYINKYYESKAKKPKKQEKKQARNYILHGSSGIDSEGKKRDSMTLTFTKKSGQAIIDKYGEYISPIPILETGDIYITAPLDNQSKRKISTNGKRFTVSLDAYAEDYLERQGAEFDRLFLTEPIFGDKHVVLKNTGERFVKLNKNKQNSARPELFPTSDDTED